MTPPISGRPDRPQAAHPDRGRSGRCPKTGDETTVQTRPAHLIVGALLPWVAIAPATVALIHRRRLSSRVVTGSVLLPVALWAQEALGHMPFPVSTAVHVPLGVALFGLSLILALASSRTR